jgi:hypothetical protein
VPDSRTRARNHLFPIGLVLRIVAMALLSGRREITEINRLGQGLTQIQRKRLNLPLKRGSKAFRKVPGYSVYYGS